MLSLSLAVPIAWPLETCLNQKRGKDAQGCYIIKLEDFELDMARGFMYGLKATHQTLF